MVSAPKEITFIKIYRSSKFSIHKISNTKHLSYTLRRGCLKTLAKLAHIMSSRLMPFWATYYTFITSSKSYLVQPFWLSLSLLDQLQVGAHVHQREEFWRQNQIALTSFSSDNFQKRWFSVQITPDRIASVVFGAFEEYSRWESWWGAGLQLPSIKYVYIWTVNQRWQLSKQNENFGANIKGMASYC